MIAYTRIRYHTAARKADATFSSQYQFAAHYVARGRLTIIPPESSRDPGLDIDSEEK